MHLRFALALTYGPLLCRAYPYLRFNEHGRGLTINGDDNSADDAQPSVKVSESELVFVGIIAFILICGCGCLSGGCGNDSGRGFFQGGALAEPAPSREEQRRDIFSNSLVGVENEWICPICAFENRPRVNCYNPQCFPLESPNSYAITQPVCR